MSLATWALVTLTLEHHRTYAHQMDPFETLFQLTVAGRPTAHGASMTRALSRVEEERNGGNEHVHVTTRLHNMAAQTVQAAPRIARVHHVMTKTAQVCLVLKCFKHICLTSSVPKMRIWSIL